MSTAAILKLNTSNSPSFAPDSYRGEGEAVQHLQCNKNQEN